jgi:hypothetical protein
VVVRDAAALRAEALRALGRAVPTNAAEGDAEADLLDPQEVIRTSSAAAVQTRIAAGRELRPTSGTPQGRGELGLLIGPDQGGELDGSIRDAGSRGTGSG